MTADPLNCTLNNHKIYATRLRCAPTCAVHAQIMFFNVLGVRANNAGPNMTTWAERSRKNELPSGTNPKSKTRLWDGPRRPHMAQIDQVNNGWDLSCNLKKMAQNVFREGTCQVIAWFSLNCFSKGAFMLKRMVKRKSRNIPPIFFVTGSLWERKNGRDIFQLGQY